jgi:hypothetical protein
VALSVPGVVGPFTPLPAQLSLQRSTSSLAQLSVPTPATLSEELNTAEARCPADRSRHHHVRATG